MTEGSCSIRRTRKLTRDPLGRMIQIMQVMAEDSEVARTRVQVLSDLL